METGAMRMQPRDLTKGIFLEEGKKAPFQAHAKADVTRFTCELQQRIW